MARRLVVAALVVVLAAVKNLLHPQLPQGPLNLLVFVEMTVVL
jgi:hypothetical protein